MHQSQKVTLKNPLPILYQMRENWKYFSKLKNKMGCPLSPFSSNTVPETLARVTISKKN